MNALQRYFKKREQLIWMYGQGDMTKNEYLQANYNAVMALNIDGFVHVESLDKALFNYQYYNALAKASAMEKRQAKTRQEVFQIENDMNYYYRQKDKATIKALEMIEFFQVEAYFIPVRSKELKGKLFEIYLLDHNMILHSANPAILKRLQAVKVFSHQKKKSLIDAYVNERY